MSVVIYTLIALILACVLSTRRLSFGNWQYWTIYGLVTVAAITGRFA